MICCLLIIFHNKIILENEIIWITNRLILLSDLFIWEYLRKIKVLITKKDWLSLSFYQKDIFLPLPPQKKQQQQKSLLWSWNYEQQAEAEDVPSSSSV